MVFRVVGGEFMDTFIDKLAQKFTAQEMIKANAAAEAAELQRTRDQVKQYDSCLQEMQKVNGDTKAVLEQMQKSLAESLEQFQNAEIPTEGLNELIESGMNRIRELQQSTEDIQVDVKQHLDEKSNELAEFVHKENVKVYRNVQAVVVDELKNQSEALEVQFSRMIKKQKGILGVAITALVFAVLSTAALVLQLLMQLGIL